MDSNLPHKLGSPALDEPAPDKQLTAKNPFEPELGPANISPLEEVIDQLARRVIHLHIERFYAAGEIVEHHDGGNGYEQTESRGHQSLRNSACHRAQTGCLLLRNTLEGVQNAHHGSEQADEWAPSNR